MGDISISNGVRSNLMALQSTTRMIEDTQNRLATGKRVNSALDNPANFFTASGMNNRAGDLSNLLDSMSTGVNTIKAADNAMSAITKLVESAQGSARQALQDAGTKTSAVIESSSALGTNAADAGGKTLTADLGLTDGESITISASNGAETSEISIVIFGGDTLDQFVSTINLLGLGEITASIGDDGKLSLASGVEGGDMTVTAQTADDVDDLFGSSATSGVAVEPSGDDNTARSELATQFNELLGQITDLSEDADFNGINLLQGDDLKITFNEKGGTNENSISLKGVDLDAAGLGLTATTNDFQSDGEINGKLDQLDDALSTLRTQASEFGSNLSVVEARQDFTSMMVDTLEKGASDLTLADVNKEGANMLALQTSQQLATTTMGIANRNDQAILSFLR